MSIMVYKHPGKHKIHGDYFDYRVVSADELKTVLGDGWSRTTSEALDAAKPKPAPKKAVKKRTAKKKPSALNTEEILKSK